MKEHFLWEENTKKRQRGKKMQSCLPTLPTVTVYSNRVHNTTSQECNFLVNSASIKPQGTSGKMVK